MIEQIYRRMYQHFGPQGWWPGDGALEICLGAILTQNTNWNNVRRALENLKAAGALDLQVLVEMPVELLAEQIRPAGYYNVKARRLKQFVQAVWTQADGDLSRFLAGPIRPLRARLLAIRGIGPETADSMILYAAGLPIFVVDAYTARILGRHLLIGPEDDYSSIQALMQANLPAEADLFNEYHALLVATGKHFCRPRPRCSGCPLEPLARRIEPAGG
jgi:endonuclease-3 related protein